MTFKEPPTYLVDLVNVVFEYPLMKKENLLRQRLILSKSLTDLLRIRLKWAKDCTKWHMIRHAQHRKTSVKAKSSRLTLISAVNFESHSNTMRLTFEFSSVFHTTLLLLLILLRSGQAPTTHLHIRNYVFGWMTIILSFSLHVLCIYHN